MLDLYRFISMDDVEDVALKDRENYKFYDAGMWLSPAIDGATGFSEEKWEMNVTDPSNNATSRLAKMVWMERDRTDARAVGKMTVISGKGIRGKTDMFVDGASMTVGMELALKVKNDYENACGATTSVTVLGPAEAGDIVKAIVYLPPGQAAGLLHFELVD